MPSTAGAALPERSRDLRAFAGPVVEWAIWIAVLAWVFWQTQRFDREIAQYAFGAAGWPRALCIAAALGATGQLIYRIAEIRRSRAAGPEAALPESAVPETAAPEPAAPEGPRPALWQRAKHLPIFIFPLIYLYLVPSVGFYVATPFFILGLLLILEVRSLRALIGVTCVIYGLVLLLFTRFFYVALPVGRIEAFYDINNAIIGIARYGM